MVSLISDRYNAEFHLPRICRETADMAVPILAVAFGLYIFGVTLVLYLRPHIMFGQGGDWKEFGIGRGEQRTVIPFWLFTIFWAFISYGVALVIMSQFATIATGAFPEPSISQQMPMPSITQQMPMPSITQQMPAQMPAQNFMKPVSSSLGIPNNAPGYYILQNPSSAGLPQYVYYGNEPPRIS